MLLSLLALVVGLAVLTVAADHFVLGAARIAARLNLSTVVIGAVVIGFGTSAPEMVVSGLAAAGGSLDIAVGNIVGSNVANLSLVLGAAAFVRGIDVASPTMRREAPITVIATVGFAIAVQDGLTRAEGILLGLGLLAALILILRASSGADPEISDEVDEYLGTEPIRVGPEWMRTLLGLVGTVASAQALVWAATDIAGRFGLEQGFVGLTIVAIGTSLPELATSIQAARKNETDLIVGNLLGSNVFNSLGVSAVAGLAGPGMVSEDLQVGAIALMLVVTVIAVLFMRVGHHVTRWQGATLLGGYLVVMPLLA
jgi:cation:H+ antiporter